jgi:hypothetical protein
MKLTLHDNIHPSAGTPHPEGRPAIDHAVRSSWAKAMHGMLRHADARAGRFAAECTVDGDKLRMCVQRHGSGSAFSAVWSIGAGQRVVAASVLLAGAEPSDDVAAVAAVAGNACCRVFGEADYARLAAEPRPCLGTLYLDARWYDNARVELAATALALAAHFGPSDRLTVSEVSRRAPSARAGGFDFTRPRLKLVMEMVAKKARAAVGGVPGEHFRVYPPREFLDDAAGALARNGIFDRLSNTTWAVRWYDGRQDRLRFGEFLGFIHQVVEIEKAYHTAVQRAAENASPRQNSSVWSRERSGNGVPVKVNGSLDPRAIVQDATIRRLFDAVELEPTVSPVDCSSR